MSLIPKKGTVYVVDDDEAVRDSLQWLLEGKDYRVRCFDSAESFLSRYDPREVACLIVDIRMGGMTGLELQDKLVERRSPLPIVFITGHGDVPMAVNTMKKGAMDFIQKPFKEDELVSLVERMLDSARESFSDYQNAANRDALLSNLTGREAQVLERIVEAYPTGVFDTIISRTVRFPETTVAGEPITTYASSSVGASSYRRLARELISKGGCK